MKLIFHLPWSYDKEQFIINHKKKKGKIEPCEKIDKTRILKELEDLDYSFYTIESIKSFRVCLYRFIKLIANGELVSDNTKYDSEINDKGEIKLCQHSEKTEL